MQGFCLPGLLLYARDLRITPLTKAGCPSRFTLSDLKPFVVSVVWQHGHHKLSEIRMSLELKFHAEVSCFCWITALGSCLCVFFCGCRASVVTAFDFGDFGMDWTRLKALPCCRHVYRRTQKRHWIEKNPRSTSADRDARPTVQSLVDQSCPVDALYLFAPRLQLNPGKQTN